MNGREDTYGRYPRPLAGARLFQDREDAGAQLARALAPYRGTCPLVLGVPRGGVPVAAVVARELDAELDVVVTRKIGAPVQRELAIGAVAADGTRLLNEDLMALVGVSRAQLERLAEEKRAEAEDRERRFRRGLPPLVTKDRIVIVVDDGLATGATLRTTLRSLAKAEAKKLIAAVPVGAPKSCERIAREVDELVCLYRPDPFFAVGLHYQRFDQTSDDEVVRILEAHRRYLAESSGHAS